MRSLKFPDTENGLFAVLVWYTISERKLMLFSKINYTTGLRECQQPFFSFNGGDLLATNKEIRTAAFSEGVRLWQVAQKLGVTDSTFSRWLRRELPEEQKKEILAIIQTLGEGRAEG